MQEQGDSVFKLIFWVMWGGWHCPPPPPPPLDPALYRVSCTDFWSSYQLTCPVLNDPALISGIYSSCALAMLNGFTTCPAVTSGGMSCFEWVHHGSCTCVNQQACHLFQNLYSGTSLRLGSTIWYFGGVSVCCVIIS